MRAVIFSDIHGNRIALERMLQDTRDKDVDYYIFCGDIIGYFDETKEVINFMKDIPNLIAVRGNHDENYLKCMNDSKEKATYADKYGISYLLNYRNCEVNFLRTLSLTKSLVIDNQNICIFHGSESDYLNGRIYPDTQLDEYNIMKKDTLYILGHTHYRLFRKWNTNLIINPGSLGQPRDNNGFSYCIYDFLKKSLEFKTVEIDKKYLIQRLNKYESSEKVKNYLFRRL